MNFKETIGIDVSKSTIDVRLHCKNLINEFENNQSGYKRLIQWVLSITKLKKDTVLFAFEHTGLYSYRLSVYLSEHNFRYILIPGLELRRSMGIARGKDDQIDAGKIALYAYRRKDEITPYELPSNEITKIKRLLSLRERLVKQKAGYEVTLKENKQFIRKNDNLVLFKVLEKMIVELKKQIDILNQELSNHISNDDHLKKIYELITSIKGIGPQTALFMIAFTNGFTRFENWRKFACYSGIAPFPHQSGISIKGRTKVSHLANKKMKSLLSSCASTAILCNPEMKQYYERRLAEGKNKMCVLNNIRNKLLARIFAVINRGTPYVNTLGYIN